MDAKRSDFPFLDAGVVSDLHDFARVNLQLACVITTDADTATNNNIDNSARADAPVDSNKDKEGGDDGSGASDADVNTDADNNATNAPGPVRVVVGFGLLHCDDPADPEDGDNNDDDDDAGAGGGGGGGGGGRRGVGVATASSCCVGYR